MSQHSSDFRDRQVPVVDRSTKGTKPYSQKVETPIGKHHFSGSIESPVLSPVCPFEKHAQSQE
jgi:hypothetical protein